MRFLVCLTLLLGAVSLPARAASFDCRKATSPTEKAICADPALAELDDRMAAAYKRGLADWNGAVARYVRLDQQGWLAERNRIGRAADGDEIEALCPVTNFNDCLRREMRRRTDTLESSAYRNSGVYKRGDDGSKLLVEALKNAEVFIRVFDRNGGPPLQSKVVEGLSGTGAMVVAADGFQWQGMDVLTVHLADDVGTYAGDCAVTMTFSALRAVVTQKGRCGKSKFAGIYRRDLTDQLANYEMSID